MAITAGIGTSGVSRVLAGTEVLVVDDERFSRSIIARFFRDMGNPLILQAQDGAEALIALKGAGDRVSVAICDFNMPVMNGLEFLKAVRCGIEGGIRRDLPVIMLTGHADHGLIGAAMALDVDAFVVKPVSKDSLEVRLARALAEAREFKEAEAYTKIDVDHITARLAPNAAPSAKPPEPAPVEDHARSALPAGRRVPLGDLTEPVVLAADLRAPGGELLLAAGMTISRRMINRLVELATMGIPIDSVWVV